MTNVEVAAIEESLKSETLCAKKIEVWRNEIQDPDLRRLAEEALQGCRRNVDMLLSELRS